MISTIRLKNIVFEDFVNYKEPSMFLITCFCDWKCCIEQGLDISICQNQPIAKDPNIDYEISKLIDLYLKNDITKSIVFGGLEPILQFNEVYSFIEEFRKVCNDTVVIYTGYKKEEIADKIFQLQNFKNIIIKFGRFIPNQESHFDPILGVNLASNNQYAQKIS